MNLFMRIILSLIITSFVFTQSIKISVANVDTINKQLDIYLENNVEVYGFYINPQGISNLSINTEGTFIEDNNWYSAIQGNAENIVGRKISNPESLIESIKFFNYIS